jgi:glycosyltransferase involved in cell wall biosynthesis
LKSPRQHISIPLTRYPGADMLSVLIPVYNFDVRELVGELSEQAQRSGKAVEIICLDDDSRTEIKNLNRAVAALPLVNYEELPSNTGRSIIRNLLAERAQYDYLLFIDCDSQTENSSFIWNYLQLLPSQKIIYGGRTYAPEAPGENALYLRWYYGSQREVVPPETRKQSPYRTFMTNNFVVERSLFLSVKMDETLKGYGHEDTLFANEMRTRNIAIEHISNPLRHVGLETNHVFLEQTRNGVKNLYRLIEQGKIMPENRLYATFRKLRKNPLGSLYLWWFRRKKSAMEESLCSPQPSLRTFDFYKLGLLLEESR